MNYSEEQVKEIFFEEMNDIFESINANMIILEVNPHNLEVVRKLFRDVHTLKGSSGVFGLKEICDLTHHAEDILDKIREGSLQGTEAIFSNLFKVFDRLKEMMTAAKKNQLLSVFDNRDFILNLIELKSIPTTSKNDEPKIENINHKQEKYTTEYMYNIFIGKCEDFFLMGIDPITLILNCRDIAKGEVKIKSITNKIPKLIAIDTEKCYFEFEIEFISEKEEKIIKDIFEFVINVGIIKIQTSIKCNKIKGKDEPTPVVSKPINKKSEPTPAQTTVITPKLTSVSSVTQTSTTSTTSNNATDTSDYLRIKKEKLDHLMNLVGELITVKNLFSHLANRLDVRLPNEEITKLFKEGSGNITRLSSRLQESVMNARMVPIGTVFTKYTRLIRDTSKKLGKKINLIIDGEDTELDKTVSEAISDPIMHLLRNAVDHGIEMPDVRISRAKSETGSIYLRASYEGNSVKIIVEDDGNGIDPQKIKEKVLKLGLTSHEQLDMMPKRDIIDFIFHSGFSTAEEITDISGRGVGMDVVRSNIRKSGGSILVETEMGKGTKFKLLLPLSLAVIDALLIGCGDETYALPQDVIIESVRFHKKDIANLNNQSSINLRDEIIPVINLAEQVPIRLSVLDNFIKKERDKMRHDDARQTKDSSDTLPIVIVQLDGIKVGILVDELYWQEQIMIKPLAGFLANISIFSGACIMGNGSVVLVLEPKDLYVQARALEIEMDKNQKIEVA